MIHFLARRRDQRIGFFLAESKMLLYCLFNETVFLIIQIRIREADFQHQYRRRQLNTDLLTGGTITCRGQAG